MSDLDLIVYVFTEINGRVSIGPELFASLEEEIKEKYLTAIEVSPWMPRDYVLISQDKIELLQELPNKIKSIRILADN